MKFTTIAGSKPATELHGQNLAELANRSLQEYDLLFQPFPLIPLASAPNDIQIIICNALGRANDCFAIAEKERDFVHDAGGITILPTKQLSITSAQISPGNFSIFISPQLSEAMQKDKLETNSQAFWELCQCIAELLALKHNETHRFHWQVIMWAMGLDPLREYKERKAAEAIVEDITK